MHTQLDTMYYHHKPLSTSRLIDYSASEQILEIPASDLIAGESLVILDHDEYHVSGRHTASAVIDDGIRVDGAWYYESEGWTFRVIFQPDTVEMILPNDGEDWVSSITTRDDRRLCIESVQFQIDHIGLEDVLHHFLSNAVIQVAKNFSWETFSRAVSKMGLKRAAKIFGDSEYAERAEQEKPPKEISMTVDSPSDAEDVNFVAGWIVLLPFIDEEGWNTYKTNELAARYIRKFSAEELAILAHSQNEFSKLLKDIRVAVG